MTTTTPEWTIIGPALIFDPAGLRAWLAVSTQHGTGEHGYQSTLAENLNIDQTYGRSGEGALSGLENLLNAMREDGEQTAWFWAIGYDVKDVGVFRTHDGATCNGALIHVDLENGLRLSSPHQDHHDFASTEATGVDAAVSALMNVAVQANALVTSYRQVTNADAEVTGRVVTIYHLTSRQRGELAGVLNVDRSVRRLPRGRDARGALTGVKLDSQYGYDLDAAVAYARQAGLRYVEVRETTFESY